MRYLYWLGLSLLSSSTAWATLSTIAPTVSVTNTSAASAPVACRLTDGASWYTAGGSSGLTDTQLRATPVPVSGTFWQTTQPVSLPSPLPVIVASPLPVTGAFYQATQPVSLASAPTTAVT